jgi:hydroxyacylglutathione hydrolase
MQTLEILPDLYQITFRYTNMFLAVGKSLSLIDTGFAGSSRHIVDFIQKIGRKPEEIELIILTHNHLDHTGGLEKLRQFTRAKVAAHRATYLFQKKQCLTRLETLSGCYCRHRDLPS